MAIENNRRGYREDTIDSGIPKDFIPNRFNKMGVDYSSSYGGGMGGTNLVGGVNLDYLEELRNRMAQQQTPQLGPDDFGSYVIPASDPTYTSGFDYARSIAGGIPMEQVIAPGVSYSPEQPGGYTQEQLTTSIGTTPVETPQGTPSPYGVFADDPRYFGTGIGGVNIPVERDKKSARLRDIFGGLKNILPPNFTQAPEDARPGILGNIDFSNLPERGFFSFDPENFKMLQNMGGAFNFDQDAIDRIVQERIAENMPIENIPSFIPEVPTGREFSVDREPIPPQDFGYGPGVLPPLPPMDIIDVPPKINDQIFIDDRPVIDERILMPPTLPTVDIPPVDIPFIPFIKPPSIMDRPLIMDTPPIMDRPTGGRFSISQPRPMGLF